jgi:hypothetical protein
MTRDRRFGQYTSAGAGSFPYFFNLVVAPDSCIRLEQ